HRLVWLCLARHDSPCRNSPTAPAMRNNCLTYVTAGKGAKTMDKELYDKGMEIRRSTLGDAYVDRALANANPFNDPLQELVTTYCWGWAWGREGISKRDRSMINIAMIA